MDHEVFVNGPLACCDALGYGDAAEDAAGAGGMPCLAGVCEHVLANRGRSADFGSMTLTGRDGRFVKRVQGSKIESLVRSGGDDNSQVPGHPVLQSQ